jgi:hypothetical protein
MGRLCRTLCQNRPFFDKVQDEVRDKGAESGLFGTTFG